LTQNKLGDIDNEIETLQRQIQDKNHQNQQQDADCELLKRQIAEQQKLLSQKDEQIAQREKKIYTLKKKT
jgi:peptidoglycan hydrolase CwlO-like protein